jgi:parvulin-like peptidyl-prolyl isomerase
MTRLRNISIDCTKVIDYLKHEVQLKRVYHQIICKQIINRVTQERGIIVTAEEIQVEADEFRYNHKLESASQTFEWLKDQLLSPEEWEAGIQERLLKKKLIDNLFGQQIDIYFNQNKVQYDQAVVYRIVVPYQPLAQEIFYQVEEEEISFFEAAHLYDIDERRRLTCGFEGKLTRWQLKPDTAARIFGATLREIIGPLQSEAGFELMMVEEFIPAELTDSTRQQISDQLFDEWLESELNHFLYSG